MARTHGLQSTYNQGCRCRKCMDGHAVMHARANERRARELAEGLVVLVHGTASTYSNWKCRCDECVEKNKERARDYREKMKLRKAAG